MLLATESMLVTLGADLRTNGKKNSGKLVVVDSMIVLTA
jgi:hypothetical protein